MAASLRQLIKFNALPCGLLPKELSQETISNPGIPVEALHKPNVIPTSLQAVHRDTGKNWETLKSRELDKFTFFSLKSTRQDANCYPRSENLRCAVLIHPVKINTLRVSETFLV